MRPRARNRIPAPRIPAGAPYFLRRNWGTVRGGRTIPFHTMSTGESAFRHLLPDAAPPAVAWIRKRDRAAATLQWWSCLTPPDIRQKAEAAHSRRRLTPGKVHGFPLHAARPRATALIDLLETIVPGLRQRPSSQRNRLRLRAPLMQQSGERAGKRHGQRRKQPIHRRFFESGRGADKT